MDARSRKHGISLADHKSVIKSGIEVNLFNSLPVVSGEVSLEDIILFKDKRVNELLSFRLMMDELYLNIIKSGDSETAMNLYIGKLQKAIMELDRVMSESKINRFRESVKIKLDISEAFNKTLIGGVGGAQFGFPTLGAATGFASSFINVSSEISLKPKHIPNELRDYAYLYYSGSEL